LLIVSSPIASLSFATFEIVNIVNSRYEYANVVNSLLYNSSDSYLSSRLTYLQQSKKMGPETDLSAIELFDPSEEF
jgi:ABC-type transporter lipoprotein component MlaA